jgi:hypothetical protein
MPRTFIAASTLRIARGQDAGQAGDDAGAQVGPEGRGSVSPFCRMASSQICAWSSAACASSSNSAARGVPRGQHADRSATTR